MPGTPILTTLDAAASADGLLLVPAGGGPWQALRELHEAMSRLRSRGLAPRLTFVHTIATDGRLVHGRHPDAAAFVLGYRLADQN